MENLFVENFYYNNSIEKQNFFLYKVNDNGRIFSYFLIAILDLAKAEKLKKLFFLESFFKLKDLKEDFFPTAESKAFNLNEKLKYVEKCSFIHTYQILCNKIFF